MKLRDFISRLLELDPNLEVLVAGNDGPSHWVGPPNVFWQYDEFGCRVLEVRYDPSKGDGDD